MITVVPAFGDPRRERPPDVYGHVIKVPTHLNVKLPAIGGHLPNADADSHLLVVRTCYNGQCKQMPRFRWSFQPKIVHGANPNLRPTVFQMSMLPSGDRKQYSISRVNSCVMNYVIVAIQTINVGYIRFTSRRKSHVFYVKPAMLMKRTILSFDQCASCRASAVELVRQNANSTNRSKQSGHKEPSWPSGIQAAGLI